MTTYYMSDAIVLARYGVGEGDAKLVCYTREFGCVAIIAKGIRLQKSKLRGHVTLFSHARMMFISVRDGYRLVDAIMYKHSHSDLVYSFSHLHHFSLFLLQLLKGTERDDKLWKFLYALFVSGTLFPKQKKDILPLKVEVLRILGMMPEEGLYSEEDVRKVLLANHLADSF
jgi:hypothetical protein